MDHQALVTILDKYTLDAVENLKLQRLKERLSPFIFSTIWWKGRSYSIPDALSRAPVNDPGPDDEITSDNVQSFSRRVVICQVSRMQQVNDEQEGEDLKKDPTHL